MIHPIRLHRLSDCVVFFDFDNTITPFDVLDDIIKRFAKDKEWMAFERRWRKGEIGSKECLEGQLRSVRITKRELLRYLSRIKLAPYFHQLVSLLKKEGIRPVILSDSFSLIIKYLLRTNGARGIKIFSNRIRFQNDKLIPSFPYVNRRCLRCGHCKKKHLLKNDLEDKIIIYIGDGLSDICPAQEADLVFAKGKLLRYFRKKNRLCIKYDDFRDIYEYLRRLFR